MIAIFKSFTGFLLGLLFFASTMAFANEGEQHAGGIPFETIKWQAINLGILLAVLFWKLKEPVKSMFAKKRVEFLVSAEKSQSLRQAAEQELKNYETQLQKLRTTAAESVARAEAEAVTAKKAIIVEAEETATRMRNETKETISAENKRAERQLKQQLIAEAIKQARHQVSSELQNHEHQKLQKAFVDNMKAVNQ